MVNPIPTFAKNVWSKWNIRGVILVSLCLQITLIFLAPFRKRSRKSYLVLLLWSTYLLADYTANFCVGLISNKYGDEDTPISSVNDFLLAFWTPFLLLHLGGPDTITAFALEDNELWLRHMLGLIVQVCLTAYVFLLTLPENTLWIPTALVFTAGIIKFAERTRSLQLASVGHFRQSIVRKPDPGPNYAKLMEELKSRVDAGLPTEIVTMPEISDDPFLDIDEPETSGGNPDHEHPKTDDEVVGAINNTSQQSDKPEPHANDNAQDQPNNGEAQDVDGAPPKTLDDDANAKINDQEVLTDVEVVKGAYDYFNKFKGLVVDMIFSFQERSDSRNYLLQRTALDALRVIEVELNFIYQAFYTKASVITNKVGFFFRLGSFASLVAALVVFVYDQKRGSNPFDVKVTYTLLYGAVALDLVSAFMLIFSDHSFALIYPHISKKISDSDGGKETSKLASILSCFLKLKRPKWREQKLKEPKWLQNKSYKILCRFMLVRRWSESISGFNLVSYCLHKRKLRLVDNKVIEYIGFKEPLEQWLCEKKQPLLQKLWIFIFTELERKSSDADDVETIQRICSSRGEWVLQEGELPRKDLNKLMSYVERNEVTFDQCLILWHIATDLLFYADKDEEDERKKKQHDDAKKNDALDLKKGPISGDGQNHNENDDAQDLEKGIIDKRQKNNEIAPDDHVKKESSEGQKKNEIAPDDVNKGSAEGKKKNENAGHKDDLVKNDFGDVDELRDFSKLLSDYLLYLVIMQPNMMSAVRGIAQIRFQDTCAEATNFFSKRQMMAEGERKMEAQGKKRKRDEEKALQKSNTMRLPPDQRIALQAKDMCKTLYDGFIGFFKKVKLFENIKE
ncbi:hypothetical protein AAZV13_08G280700 [Glycine max]